MFNLQFDKTQSIDSIQVALHKYDDDEFLYPNRGRTEVPKIVHEAPN